MNNWEDLEAPQNVCIASIPTVFNASLAPPGKAVVHAYTAGNEPYSLWEGLDRRGQDYKKLKASCSVPHRSTLANLLQCCLNKAVSRCAPCACAALQNLAGSLSSRSSGSRPRDTR